MYLLIILYLLTFAIGVYVVPVRRIEAKKTILQERIRVAVTTLFRNNYNFKKESLRWLRDPDSGHELKIPLYNSQLSLAVYFTEPLHRQFLDSKGISIVVVPLQTPILSLQRFIYENLSSSLAKKTILFNGVL